MLARKCDRCGRLYEAYEGHSSKDTGKANGVWLVDMDTKNNYTKRRVYDLCPTCMIAIHNFLTNQSKSQEEI